MIHVITAFSRPETIARVYESLARQNVIWHLIPSGATVPDAIRRMPDVYVHEGFNRTGLRGCEWLYAKLNWFAENITINDKDFYGVLNDDDIATPGCYDKVRLAISKAIEPDYWETTNPYFPEVVFISQHFAPGMDLIAAPENMRPSKVFVEQSYIRGVILKQHRYVASDVSADGYYNQVLAKCRKCIYVPDAWVIFNALQADRWTSDELARMMGAVPQ